MEKPEDAENALAGLLTGMMVTLMGGAFPAAIAWHMATHWSVVTSQEKVMSWSQAMQGVTLIVVSIPILRFGLKMLQTNGAALLRR